MGGKSGDVSVDTEEVFPGLRTPSFSLLRSQRAPTVRGFIRGPVSRGRRIPGEGGTTAIPNLRGGFNDIPVRPVPFTSGGGAGPFVLTRTGPDPVAAENRVIEAFRGIGEQFGALRDFTQANRADLRNIRAGIPAVFANTQALRERNLALQEDVEPGFGRLTESQVTALRNREAAEQGNLREALAARRVLGSSFAQREQQALSREFGQEEQRVRAESFVTELGVQQDLIQQAGQLIQLDQATIAQQGALLGLEMGLTDQEAALLGRQMQTIQAENQVLTQRVQRELQELAISGNIINGVTSAAAQLAGVQAQAAAEEASGFGQLIGSLGGAVIGGLFGK